MSVMTPAELDDFLRAAFPETPPPVSVTRSDEAGVEVRLPYRAAAAATRRHPVRPDPDEPGRHRRLRRRRGPHRPEFLTVTSHLSIDFLHKPPPADLRATGEVLKLGRRQAVVAIRIHSADADRLVATSTATYALPSKRSR